MKHLFLSLFVVVACVVGGPSLAPAHDGASLHVHGDTSYWIAGLGLIALAGLGAGLRRSPKPVSP